MPHQQLLCWQNLPVTPENGYRQCTLISGPAYLFRAHGLALILTANHGQVPTGSHAGWPYLMFAYLEGSAEPDVLNARVREVIQILGAAGIKIGAEKIWPGV